MKHTKAGKLYTDIVLEVFKLNGLLIAEGDKLVKEFGLTSARWKVLGALALTGEPLTVSRIAVKMGQTRQGVQRIADVMETEGLITYVNNPYHKKARLVKLTEKGTDLYSKADDKQIDWSNTLADNIDIVDAETALKVLRAVYCGLQG
ncbi:transcriptional regulator, MarR family [Denitrovibrio acetiphilus DSM 12809]|uniref:Transcriptional regulator, MarR family n=1 Tax=Denitrovibrio acetiphilus (strain DSM 12809 / NBRC 114555 / N2460) TaxID=522772 RepID=D4H610_DENA2|nr:MarR family winged helix-turn-helix transcriptional regulator [Denitrovibrio acetiphilus]ADD67656.1 transcriptional regulator, MarR family [Denitrovibrio acetiphilus DSM 12809]